MLVIFTYYKSLDFQNENVVINEKVKHDESDKSYVQSKQYDVCYVTSTKLCIYFLHTSKPNEVIRSEGLQ